MTRKQIKKRLEYLRREIRAERISYGELAELQSLSRFIDKDDVELLQWAGVPENENTEYPTWLEQELSKNTGGVKHE